jgi:hypothetical protein
MMSCVSERIYVDSFCENGPEMKLSEQDILAISDELARDIAIYRCSCKFDKKVCDAINEFEYD